MVCLAFGMRWLSVIAVLFLSNNLPAAEPAAGRLFLRTGEIFSGHLVSVDPGKSIAWRHRFVKEMLRVDAKEVDKIILPETPLPPAAKSSGVLLRLANGDVLVGEMVEMGEDALTLDTWYAGRLKVARKFVRVIEWDARQQLVNPLKALKPGKSLLMLNNGDDLAGEAVRITKDDVFWDTDFTTRP